MRVRLAPQARADLDAIWPYVARESGSQDQATRTVSAIAGRFGLFAQYPNIGKTFASSSKPAVRTFPVGNYRIFYRPEAGEIRTLRVIHSSREVEAMFAAN